MKKEDYKLFMSAIHKYKDGKPIGLTPFGEAVTERGTIKLTEDNFREVTRSYLESKDATNNTQRLYDVTNEFMTQLFNVVVVQRFFAGLSRFTNPLGIFFVDGTPFGDEESGIVVNVKDDKDYDTTTDPLKNEAIPNVYTWIIKTNWKKKWELTISSSILKGAMLEEASLTSITSSAFAQLNGKQQRYLFSLIQNDLKLNITNSKSITSITDSGQVNQARRAWEEIVYLTHQMSLPSKDYINATIPSTDPTYETFTELGSAVLLVNARYASSLLTNVFAPIFHSDKISPNKLFSKIILIETDATLIGYILDTTSYMISYRINETGAIYNPNSLRMNYFFHKWIKTGFNKYLNAIKLTPATTSTRKASVSQQKQYAWGIQDDGQGLLTKTFDPNDKFYDQVKAVVKGYNDPLEPNKYVMNTVNGGYSDNDLIQIDPLTTYYLKGKWIVRGISKGSALVESELYPMFSAIIDETDYNLLYNEKNSFEIDCKIINGVLTDTMGKKWERKFKFNNNSKEDTVGLEIRNNRISPYIISKDLSGEDGSAGVLTFEYIQDF